MWSIGVMFYEMLTGILQLIKGRTPWSASNEKELLDKLLKQPVTYNSSISTDTKDLISRLLQTDESKRMTLKEFETHPLITKATSILTRDARGKS